MKEKIVFDRVDMTYKIDGREIRVFEQFDLEIDPSAFTVLIGKSGSGKTTLLRLIAGLETPTAGKLSIPPSLRIGMMFQEARLMPWLTCEKNVLLGLPKDSRKEARDILRLVGLEGFEKAFPYQLSGGMQQRAALARTLMRKANYLLMDEPFGALDAITRKQMQQELLRIRAETNAGILFVTHDIEEATTLGDRIVTIGQKY